MKKSTAPAVAAVLLLTAVCLFAADFWAKPYTEWSDKDIQKMLSNSPWAKPVAVSMGEGGGERGGKGRGSNGRPGTMGETGGLAGPATSSGNTAPGVSSQPGSAGRGDQMEQSAGGGAPQMNLQLVWQSALPIKEASVKRKYGSEAGASEEGQKYLKREETSYVMIMSVPAGMARGGDMSRLKEALKENTSLNVKGKDPIKPTQVDVANGMALFAFPKTNPITVDDKEVEFNSKLGSIVVKMKFDLKHMVYNGKLEL